MTGLRKIADEAGLSGRRHWWRARVAFELGLVGEGEAAMFRFEREPHGEAWTGWGRAQLLLYAAEAHARRGDLAKALASLDRLEHLFRRADRDFAQLESAKTLRWRLGVGMAPAAGRTGGSER